MRASRLWVSLVALAMALPAAAQDLEFPDGNVIPNYNRMSIGQREGLEAGAFVARTDDAAANWYNPAGLARSEKVALNASGNAYEYTTVALAGLRVPRARAVVAARPTAAPRARPEVIMRVSECWKWAETSTT